MDKVRKKTITNKLKKFTLKVNGSYGSTESEIIDNLEQIDVGKFIFCNTFR